MTPETAHPNSGSSGRDDNVEITINQDPKIKPTAIKSG